MNVQAFVREPLADLFRGTRSTPARVNRSTEQPISQPVTPVEQCVKGLERPWCGAGEFSVPRPRSPRPR